MLTGCWRDIGGGTGEILVRYSGATGEVLARYWRDTDGILARYSGATGEILARYWQGAGEILARHWRGTGVPGVLVDADAGPGREVCKSLPACLSACALRRAAEELARVSWEPFPLGEGGNESSSREEIGASESNASEFAYKIVRRTARELLLWSRAAVVGFPCCRDRKRGDADDDDDADTDERLQWLCFFLFCFFIYPPMAMVTIPYLRRYVDTLISSIRSTQDNDNAPPWGDYFD